MTSPGSIGKMPLSYMGIDEYQSPLFINALRPPTVNDIYVPGTRWQDSSSNPITVYETTGGGIWTGAEDQIVNGNFTVSTGNVIIATIGKGLEVKAGTNGRMGTATLVNGQVTVNNTTITSNTMVILTRISNGTSSALGVFEVTEIGGISFTIKAYSPEFATPETGDNSVVRWLLVEAI